MDRNFNWEGHWGDTLKISPDNRVVVWKNSFMNWNIYVLDITTYIQYPCSESMHICYNNVDPKQVIICYRTIWLIKVNTLDMIIVIYKVSCNELLCIIIAISHTKGINERMEDLCSIREGFDWYGIRKSVKIIVLLSYCTNKTTFQNGHWGTLRFSAMFLRSIWFSGRRT